VGGRITIPHLHKAVAVGSHAKATQCKCGLDNAEIVLSYFWLFNYFYKINYLKIKVMKHKFLLFLIAFIAVSFYSNAQKKWGEWTFLKNNSGVEAYISFSEVKTCGTMRYCYYRLRNDKAFTNYVTLLNGSFKYTDCDGKERKVPFNIQLGKTGVDEAGGYWYLSNGSGVYDVTVERVVK